MSEFPYPGLRPFKREETDIFFGRDEISNQLIDRLGSENFLAVVGLSGCGKSSLVHTGLLAGLERGFLASAGIHWRIAEFRPGDRPFANLAEALLTDKAVKNEYTAQFVDSTEASKLLEADLKRGPLSLYEILQDSPLPPRTNLLIVVDQFEELFRYYRQKGKINESEAFVRLLLKSCQHQAVYIVITMRSDFMSDCALFHGLPEAINNGLFLTPRLTRQQLTEIIEWPAKVFMAKVDPKLTNRLLNDMESDPEKNRLLNQMDSNPEQLPVLQHVLMRMWRLAKAENPQQTILTLGHYEQAGRLANALSQHVDKTYTELEELIAPPNSQKVAEILFRRLCERDPDRRNTRNPVKLAEVATLAKLSSWQQLVPIVDAFRQEGHHFLTPPLDKELTSDSVLDISHESLIHYWKRLKGWVKEEAESADMYRRLEDTARRWENEQAELWQALDLQNALAWYQAEQPTVLWASRYGQQFELAMRFLSASENKQKQIDEAKERQRREKEEAQQRDLKQARKIAIQTRTIAFLSLAGFLLTTVLAVWGFVERHHALAQKNIAEQAKLETQINNVTWLARFEDYAQSHSVLNEIKDIPTVRHHAYNFLNWFNQLMGGTPQQIYQGANLALFAVAISDNGKWLASAGEKGTLVLFNVNSGQLLQHLEGHTEDVKAVIFYQNQWLISAGNDGHIIFWSLPTGKIIKRWKAPDKVKALALSPDGKYLASAGTDNKITLWNLETDQPQQIFSGHKDQISGLAFSSDGELLASASYDGTARLWQVKTGKVLHTLKAHTDHVQKVAFSHDNQWLATSSKDATIRLWNVNSGKTERVLRGHKQIIFDIRFIDHGQTLVSASDDRTLRLWDIQSGVTKRVFQGHTAGVTGIATFDNKIFSASDDGTVILWNSTLPYQQSIDFAITPISVAIAPTGNHIAVGFAEGSLRLYALPELNLLWEQQTAHTAEIKRLAFNPDGTLLASASYDHNAKLWQVQEGQLLQTLNGHTDKIHAVAFSPDGKMLATASFDGQVGLLTIDTQQKRFYQAHDGKDVNAIAFNADGTQLLTTGDDDVRLWALNHKPPQLLNKYTPANKSLIWSALSLDNQWISSVGSDQIVYVYSAIDKTIQYRFEGHESTIYRVIFSPDGQQIATASADATLRLWDLYNGNQLLSLRLPTHSGKPVSFKDFDFRCTPQGCWIAVPLSQGKLMLYEIDDKTYSSLAIE
ncbi:WD-40 repeat protein [Beggiatoa sp. PS]|nr:WD-40 repeat protein [Beggiatoa sp. PS]